MYGGRAIKGKEKDDLEKGTAPDRYYKV